MEWTVIIVYFINITATFSHLRAEIYQIQFCVFDPTIQFR